MRGLTWRCVMSDLAAMIDKVEALLMDSTNATWDTDTITGALRRALQEFTINYPAEVEDVLELEAAGREIDISSLTGVNGITALWWPYDSSAENWPPNKIRGWRFWWDGSAPKVILDLADIAQPESGDKVRIWYTVPQTIEDLDSATATSLRTEHEGIVVIGAVGIACLSRVAELVNTAEADSYMTGILGTLGRSMQRDFRFRLRDLRREGARSGPSWAPAGWSLDKWAGSGDLG